MLDPQGDLTRASRAHITPTTPRQGIQPAKVAGLLALLLISLVAIPRGPALADGSQSGTVNSSDGLNLRSGPGTSYGILTVMPNGASLTITGAAQNSTWLPVTYNSQNGFADGTYISVGGSNPVITASGASSSGAASLAAVASPTPVPSPAATPSPTPATTSATVLPPDGLNLRSGPGSSNPVLLVMPGGASVTITGVAQSGWEPVTYNGQSGWADGVYLSTDGSDPLISASGAAASGPATLAAASATPSAHGATASPTPAATAASGYKLAWPTVQRRISTVFSPSHLGIDIDQFDNPTETIHASAAGTVVFAGGDACCSYGYYVDIDHGNGLLTRYAHMSRIIAKQGQVVQQGDPIGIVGCTGKCTGPHIHYEVHVNGTPVDPLSMLPPPWNIE